MKTKTPLFLKKVGAIAALTIVLTMWFALPVAHADNHGIAGSGIFDFSNTERAADADNFDSDQNGIIGGALDVAGNAIGDALGGLFGSGSGGDDDDITTFSDFKGGLTAPTGDGLDPTLKRVSSAREFIISTVNFVLSFLGIIAVIVVIYGGFLYVTAAGDEEKTGKGKKSITFAVIGIVIIIGSYALVNTVINNVGTGGTDRGENGIAQNGGVGGVDPALRGAAGGVGGAGGVGSNNSQQIAYNLGAIELKNSLNEYIAAYKNLIAIDALVKKILALPEPDGYSESVSLINEVKSILIEIRNRSALLSRTHVVANDMLNEYIAGFQTLSREDFEVQYEDSSVLAEIKEKINDPAYDPQTAAERDFTAYINSLIAEGDKDKFILPGTLRLVQETIGDLATEMDEANAPEYALDPQVIQRAFDGVDRRQPLGKLFETAIESFKAAKSIADEDDDPPTSSPNIARFVSSTKALYRLLLVVQSIKYVNVKINASARQGNAPFIVEINGLGSSDPTGMTITDSQYDWDPEGDGDDGTGENVECTPSTGAASLVCTYKKPGTYQVTLKIKSNDPRRIADGTARFPITVMPPLSNIELKAKVGGGEIQLKSSKKEGDTDDDGFQSIDKSEFHITLKEGSETPIKYDANNSKGGDGKTLKNFAWTFGDGTKKEEAKDKSVVEHQYKKPGNYTLMLEVTDNGNRKDRKIVNVVVSSIASRITTNKNLAQPEDIIELDGSSSRSDNGVISTYKWELVKKATAVDGLKSGRDKDKDVFDDKEIVTVIGDRNKNTLRFKLRKPGEYEARLTVTDGASGQDTSEVETILIKSRKPRAGLTLKACPLACPDATHPGTVQFDASSSFDPDRDELAYVWKFFDENDTEIQNPKFVDEKNKPIALTPTSKKFRVDFDKVGTYKAELTVNDPHPAEIRQQDTITKEFKIESIVEAAWHKDMVSVTKLVDGTANIKLRGTTKHATTLTVDYGDGQVESPTPTKDDGTFEFEHDYSEAGSYLVTLNAKSEEGDGETTIVKRVYVARANEPFPLITATVDEQEIILPQQAEGAMPPALELMRKQIVKLDASKSLSSAGTTTGLNYLWEFGDGSSPSTKQSTTHGYTELTPPEGTIMVQLTVSETANPSKQAKTTFPIRVVTKRPEATFLTVTKQGQADITPLDVSVQAEGAVDLDGKITSYQFWYYAPTNPEQKLGIVDTTEPQAILTLETIGEANEDHEYLFCMSITDNENNTATCTDLFNENEIPRLRVKNGPNQAPTVSITASKTAAHIGEEITLTANAQDSDGRVAKYIWDLDGDGFQNDQPTELSSVTKKYEKKSGPNGYRVKLKVLDDKNAAGFSKEIPIFISSESNDPSVDFSYQVLTTPAKRVKFFDLSTTDEDKGAQLKSWKWNFGTTPTPTTIDSTDANPTFDFPRSERFKVTLTVEDTKGNTATKSEFIELVPGLTGTTASANSQKRASADSSKTGRVSRTGTQGSNVGATLKPKVKAELEAQLTNGSTSKVEYNFNCTSNNAANCNKKVLHIPATSCKSDVTFLWGGSRGDVASYQIDKNIYYDSDLGGTGHGDGIRNNDVDSPLESVCTLPSTGVETENCWTTPFAYSYTTAHPEGAGHFRARLTVTDADNQSSIDTVDVVFDVPKNPEEAQAYAARCGANSGSSLSGSLFKDIGIRSTILWSLGGGILFVFALFGVMNYSRHGKTRV